MQIHTGITIIHVHICQYISCLDLRQDTNGKSIISRRFSDYTSFSFSRGFMDTVNINHFG